MPDSAGNPTDIEQYESAAAAAEKLAADADCLALCYWTGDGVNKLEDITDCLADTPLMNRAAGKVGDAYRQLSDALRVYRAVAKRAIDVATEKERQGEQ